MLSQEWNQKDISKVPVDLLFHKNGAFLTFNLWFQGLDVVGVYMKKSQEWFYGIYEGPDMKGYLHFGEIPFADHFATVNEILPKNINNLQKLIDKYEGRNQYHLCDGDSFLYVGKAKDRNVIIKKSK